MRTETKNSLTIPRPARSSAEYLLVGTLIAPTRAGRLASPRRTHSTSSSSSSQNHIGGDVSKIRGSQIDAAGAGTNRVAAELGKVITGRTGASREILTVPTSLGDRSSIAGHPVGATAARQYPLHPRLNAPRQVQLRNETMKQNKRVRRVDADFVSIVLLANVVFLAWLAWQVVAR